MFDKNKAIITKIFKIISNDNTKYIKIIVINIYSINIDNPNIKLII